MCMCVVYNYDVCVMREERGEGGVHEKRWLPKILLQRGKQDCGNLPVKQMLTDFIAQ